MQMNKLGITSNKYTVIMDDKIKIIRVTIGLLNSMVNGGEQHSETSRAYVQNAFKALDELVNKQ